MYVILLIMRVCFGLVVHSCFHTLPTLSPEGSSNNKRCWLPIAMCINENGNLMKARACFLFLIEGAHHRQTLFKLSLHSNTFTGMLCSLSKNYFTCSIGKMWGCPTASIQSHMAFWNQHAFLAVLTPSCLLWRHHMTELLRKQRKIAHCQITEVQMTVHLNIYSVTSVNNTHFSQQP